MNFSKSQHLQQGGLLWTTQWQVISLWRNPQLSITHPLSPALTSSGSQRFVERGSVHLPVIESWEVLQRTTFQSLPSVTPLRQLCQLALQGRYFQDKTAPYSQSIKVLTTIHNLSSEDHSNSHFTCHTFSVTLFLSHVAPPLKALTILISW